MKTEQPATFWLERTEEVHVSIILCKEIDHGKIQMRTYILRPKKVSPVVHY